jgi:hypothetical protein
MNFQERLEHYAIASLREEICPDATQLAAYASGTLSGTQQLIVAAHVRLCPICTHDLELAAIPDLADRWALAERSIVRPRFAIARLIDSIAAGRVRGIQSPKKEDVRQYVAADIAINLVIAPPAGERWRISGYVTQGGTPLAERTVALRSRHRRLRQQTNEDGFFTFEQISAGQYTLSIVEATVSIQIRGLVLSLPT